MRSFQLILQSVIWTVWVTHALPRVKVASIPADGVPALQQEGINTTWLPRGSNYIRLQSYHSTFSPLYYNRSEAVNALVVMQAAGFNIARVFLDHGGSDRTDGVVSGPSSTGLSKSYMHNVADFITLAAQHNIYTVITLEGLPVSNDFACSSPDAPYPNAQTMTAACVHQKARYARMVLESLHEQLIGDLSAVAWLSIENEAFVQSNLPPFNTTKGFFTGFDGKTYDLSLPQDRQQLLRGSFNNWAQTTCAAAKEVDAAVLCTSGMYTMAAVGKDWKEQASIPPCSMQDCRVPLLPEVLQSVPAVDLLDVHVYQVRKQIDGHNFTMALDLASSDWDQLNSSVVQKPVILGEFGAWKNLFVTVDAAVTPMVQQQVLSCSFRFRGWMFWTFDTYEQTRLWNLQSEQGQLRVALAPAHRSDPCHA